MKLLLIILTLLLLSCNRHENKSISSKIDFAKIPYNLSSHYSDSIAKKIIPNTTYKYWQYVSYYEPAFGGHKTYKILTEGGDTILRKSVNTKIDPIKLNGLFEGGHPSFRSNYLVVVENEKIKYLDTMEQLRDFIGKIDNLEEALLFAKSYGYCLGSKRIAQLYNFSNDTYTLRLTKSSDSYPETLFRLRAELVELSITTDGFMKSKSLGIYCEGKECLE